MNKLPSHPIGLTFDVENDCGLSSYQGLQTGLPRIIQLLNKYHVPATFFVTGEVAENFPDIIRALSRKHEIGCHGYYHESLKQMDSEKEKRLTQAKRVLQELTDIPIIGFRAPYLRVSQKLFIVLKRLGFKYDSSLTYFKFSHWNFKPGLREFPTMFPNVVFRFPLVSYLYRIGSLLNDLPVFYFHPWEAIDVRSLFIQKPHYSWNIFSRPDRWLNSGLPFIRFLSQFIQFHQTHGFQFKTLYDML